MPGKKLRRVRVEEDKISTLMIIDFEGDRHHALCIRDGISRNLFAAQLRSLAARIEQDRLLD